MFERFIDNLEKRTLVYVFDARRKMSSSVMVEKFCQKDKNLTHISINMPSSASNFGIISCMLKAPFGAFRPFITGHDFMITESHA